MLYSNQGSCFILKMFKVLKGTNNEFREILEMELSLECNRFGNLSTYLTPKHRVISFWNYFYGHLRMVKVIHLLTFFDKWKMQRIINIDKNELCAIQALSQTQTNS